MALNSSGDAPWLRSPTQPDKGWNGQLGQPALAELILWPVNAAVHIELMPAPSFASEIEILKKFSFEAASPGWKQQVTTSTQPAFHTNDLRQNALLSVSRTQFSQPQHIDPPKVSVIPLTTALVASVRQGSLVPLCLEGSRIGCWTCPDSSQALSTPTLAALDVTYGLSNGARGETKEKSFGVRDIETDDLTHDACGFPLCGFHWPQESTLCLPWTKSPNDTPSDKLEQECIIII